MLEKLRKILPHVNLILAGMFLCFWIFDKFNRAMNFIANDISKALLLIFCISAIANAIVLIADDRRNNR